MTGTAEAPDLEEARWCYRMKDLCEATGLPRQAIHFYIQQGLLPAGRKTGRNMAWYTEEHLERLHLIKKLQHERFLPLKAIKALFDGEDGVFSPRQHAFLAGVKERLAESLKTSEDRSPTLTPAQIAEQNGIDAEDVERAFELGLVGGARSGDALRIAAADVWIFEVFGRVRALGFTPGNIRWWVFSEYGFLLLLGLAAGGAASLMAILPAARAPGADLPLMKLLLLTALVAANGLLWIWVATRAAVHRTPLAALSEE